MAFSCAHTNALRVPWAASWRPSAAGASARLQSRTFADALGQGAARSVQLSAGTMAFGDDNRRLLEKLIRETVRAEAQAIEAPEREARRMGASPPIEALIDVADHAEQMQHRFEKMLEGHDLQLHMNRGALGSTLSTLRHLVVDRVVHPERAYRTVLLDLRHGLEVVKLLREITRRQNLFGLVRWCDDWLRARRTLVARVEAQLSWFMDQETLGDTPASSGDPADSWEPVEER